MTFIASQNQYPGSTKYCGRWPILVYFPASIAEARGYVVEGGIDHHSRSFHPAQVVFGLSLNRTIRLAKMAAIVECHHVQM